MIRNYRPEMVRYIVGPMSPFILKISSIIAFEFGVSCEDIILEVPKISEMGDFAFPLQRLIGKTKMSKEKAETTVQRIIDRLEGESIVSKVQLDGRYLNIFLNRVLVNLETMATILSDSDYGNSHIGRDEKVMVEYSSPNTNKSLHLGHVRNNVLGMAVANTLEASGFHTIRACLVNDRGIHISQSMLGYLMHGNNATPQSTGIKGDHLVGDCYVAYQNDLRQERTLYLRSRGIDVTQLNDREKREVEQEFLAQSPLAQKAQEMLGKWEEGDSEIRDLWQRMNAWTYAGFDETYRIYGSVFDKTYFESDTYLLGRDIVQRGINSGIFISREDGAVIVKLGKPHNDKVLLRSDGTTVYITQDIGTAVLKFEEFGLDRSVYVVANEQDNHFQVLFRILELLGYPWAQNCYHLSYGMVELPEGKMKSREGKVVDADDLIVELTNMALEKISQSSKAEEGLPESAHDLHSKAENIALAAVKFYFLKFSPRSTVLFDPKESLDFEGMTGPYLQYVIARSSSILAKAEDVTTSSSSVGLLNSDDEYSIIKHLALFPGIIAESALRYDPSILANYLGDLARAYNSWYHTHPVLKAETSELMRARLLFVKSVKQVMTKGLKLLGIEPVEKM